MGVSGGSVRTPPLEATIPPVDAPRPLFWTSLEATKQRRRLPCRNPIGTYVETTACGAPTPPPHQQHHRDNIRYTPPAHLPGGPPPGHAAVPNSNTFMQRNGRHPIYPSGTPTGTPLRRTPFAHIGGLPGHAAVPNSGNPPAHPLGRAMANPSGASLRQIRRPPRACGGFQQQHPSGTPLSRARAHPSGAPPPT